MTLTDKLHREKEKLYRAQFDTKEDNPHHLDFELLDEAIFYLITMMEATDPDDVLEALADFCACNEIDEGE